MRLFLAIYPPKTYLDYVRDVMQQMSKHKRNLRPIKTEQVHVTVKFIGPQVSEDSKDMIAEALQKRRTQYTKPTYMPEGLSLGIAGQYDPRVLMVNLEDKKDVRALEDELHAIIRDLRLDDTINWKQDDRVGPHLSFARVKQNVGPRVARDVREEVRKLNLQLPEEFTAEEIWLVRSDLKADGPVYTKLEQIKL